jgi:hypothetical protein
MRFRPSHIVLALALAFGVGAPRDGFAQRGGRQVAKRKWPEKKRYVEVMYNADKYIRDPKLRGASVQRDQKGERPIVYSGSFSSVFKLTTGSGRKIAMRVFHPSNDVAERQDLTAFQERYKRLGNYLATLRTKRRLPPEIVEFALVDDGIRVPEVVDGKKVGEQILPIMKLPWISGRNLDEWVGRRLGQGRGKAVGLLAENWRAALKDLAAVGIAHGDLHHGNISLESNGAMRFVDYDSMYVPALKGLPNSEIGHPNYQHPAYHWARDGKGNIVQRASARPFDSRMDHFSSIVIFLSLKAIAAEPALWDKYHDEGNNLIFDGQRDLADPDNSPVFADLKRSKDPLVRALARDLARYAKGSPGNTPSLEQAIERASTPFYQRK